MLRIEGTKISGCYIIRPEVFSDERGHFIVPYSKDEFNKIIGQEIDFKQDNQSYSKYGVIRGLHFQREPYAQSKLVRCVVGEVLDVVVDIRKESPTFGQHITIDLSETNHKMVFVPKGCAHGFSTLSDYALFTYKVDAPYNKDSEDAIRYDDPDLGIDWKIPYYIRTVSEKDKIAKFLKDIKL